MYKRIFRTFTQNKGRYIGILLLLLFGSFLFVVATGVSRNMDGMLTHFETANKQEDVTFTTSAPLADIPALEAASGADIEGYLSYDTALGEDAPLRLLSAGAKVNLPAVRAGEWLSRPGDILLDPYFMTFHHLNIGDTLDIEGQAFHIVGTVALPQYVYVLKNIYDILPPSGFGVGVIAESDFSLFPGAQTVYGARFTDRENLNGQLTELHGLLNQEGAAVQEWVDAGNNKRIRMPWASINGLKAMSVPLPSAMFLLSCLIVGILTWRTIKADSVVIGALYAQGLRRKELTRHYMALPVLLAALAGVLGALLGLPCVAPVVNMMLGSYYNVPNDGASLSLFSVLPALLLPVLFVGLASWLVVRGVLKKNAAELMKGDEESAKVNILERSVPLDKFKFATRFKLRAQLRSIPRLLFLFFGVMSASIILLLGFTISYSMNTALGGADAADMYNFNWEYSFREVRTDPVPEGAAPFNAMRCYPEGQENLEFYITGIQPQDGGVRLTDKKGQPLPLDQVNITTPLASRLRLDVGDAFSFVNKVDGHNYQLTVAGIADTYVGQFIFMPLDQFNQMAGYPAAAYSGVFSQTPLAYDDRELAGVKDMSTLSGAMSDLTLPMNFMVAAITIFGGLMAAIIIYLVTSLMIEESRGTISLMKVFGYRRKELNHLILNSSDGVVLLGFVLAIPLMAAMAGALYGYLGEMINLALPILISPVYVLVSFVILLFVYLFTKQVSKKKLNQVSMGEALKSGAE